MTLRGKLKSLTAPCRGVDAEIAVMFQALPANLQHIDDGLTVHPDETTCPHLIEVRTADGSWLGGFPAIPFTASLDATVELVERELPKLPEWIMLEWTLQIAPGGYWACVGHDYSMVSGALHKLPAVALLLALLDAKELALLDAKESGDE